MLKCSKWTLLQISKTEYQKKRLTMYTSDETAVESGLCCDTHRTNMSCMTHAIRDITSTESAETKLSAGYKYIAIINTGKSCLIWNPLVKTWLQFLTLLHFQSQTLCILGYQSLGFIINQK